ncbi:DUF3667 domain-containing protein [Alkalimonas collagenimarina]|uniref:DUF3667 domain-containing protein n=1 Tax=Alkalimonas collagenimarina TaxID=400390 RepID=A0ABT9GZT8_9GAMM|nr:DUF3667 domain-containing protein [Alkalimonas collagenimarina]MDP4536564.1 DUF3667 domain-containing protein [Alkalimonas collagenimarina]
MDTAVQQCDNCNSFLQGDFCHHCGQEKKSYIRNVSGVVTEFFGEFSNWDTRLWRTLLPLWFRPSFLSTRYVNGHRVPYVPPLRLYFFTSVVVFLILAQLVPHQAIEDSSNSDPGMIMIETNDGKQMTLGQLLRQIEADVREGNTVEAESWEQVAVNVEKNQYELPLPFLSSAAQQRVDERFNAFIANPRLAINKFFSLAPQMMFLLLPVFALLLKLMYIRCNRFYMEHLIVALHSHSFILQVGVFCILLGVLQNSIPWPWLASSVGWLKVAFAYWIPLYLLLCQKFYYQQGWGRTLFKFWLTSSLYNLLFVALFFILILLSVLWM